MVLSVKNLSFEYKNNLVLKDLSFELPNGKTLAILGKNGAGKSTLLSILLSILPFKKGEILLNNTSYKNTKIKQRARQIGFVPQSETNTFSFSVKDMILFGLNASISLFSSPSKEDEKKAIFASELAGCKHLLEANIDEISGGQMQLVLIARALVNSPKLLIMDEPTSYLDTARQNEILRLISRLNENNIAVIFSSHYPDHTMMVSHYSLLLKGACEYVFGKSDEVMSESNLNELFGIEFQKIQTNSQSRILPKWSF